MGFLGGDISFIGEEIVFGGKNLSEISKGEWILRKLK